MPVLPPASLPPYDIVETVLMYARVIANDMGQSEAGNLLSDSQPYTLPLLNLAWRKLQDRLANNAIESFPQEVIITGIPAQDSTVLTDPSIQSYINYSGYWDGVTLWQGYSIPQDCEIPLRLWERVSGSNSNFVPMFPSIDGLPTRPKGNLLVNWEWRDDAIYLVGANGSVDVRIRYKRFLIDQTSTTQPIPLLRCATALAYIAVEIFCTGRGSPMLPAFSQQKEDAIKQLINSTARKMQRTNFRRIPYSRRGFNQNW